MEVYYCKACRKRVSSVDIENSAGVQVGNTTYCRPCAHKHKIPLTGAAPAASKPSSSARGSARLTAAAASPRSGRTATPRASNPAPIILAVLVITLLVAILMVLALKPDVSPNKTASQSDKPIKTYVEVDPEPEPVPRRPQPRTQPVSPARQPVTQPSPAPASAAAATGAIDLLSGGSLHDAEWVYYHDNPGYGEAITIENSILKKSPSELRNRVYKKIDLTDGEFNFEFYYSGSYLKFLVYKTSADNRMSVQFTRKVNGRHTCRIVFRGTRQEVYFDDVLVTEGMGMYLKDTLSKPLSDQMTISIDTKDDASLKLWNFTFTPAAPQPSPAQVMKSALQQGGVNLLAGTSLAAAGWEHNLNADGSAEEFIIENGVLKRSPSTFKSQIRKQLELLDGEFSFEFDYKGTYLRFIFRQPNASTEQKVKFSTNANGRHTCRIKVRGTNMEVYFDDTLAAEANGVFIEEAKASKKRSPRAMLRIDTIQDVNLKLWNFTFTPAEIQPVPQSPPAAFVKLNPLSGDSKWKISKGYEPELLADGTIKLNKLAEIGYLFPEKNFSLKGTVRYSKAFKDPVRMIISFPAKSMQNANEEYKLNFFADGTVRLSYKKGKEISLGRTSASWDSIPFELTVNEAGISVKAGGKTIAKNETFLLELRSGFVFRTSSNDTFHPGEFISISDLQLKVW